MGLVRVPECRCAEAPEEDDEQQRGAEDADGRVRKGNLAHVGGMALPYNLPAPGTIKQESAEELYSVVMMIANIESPAFKRMNIPTHCPVLVVEDDEGLREMMAQLLTLEGFQTATVANGQEALDIPPRRAPDPRSSCST